MRKGRLTASTFGSAVGFWPGRRVQLWLEKLGAVEPFTGNLATCWNNIKEREALERYRLITGCAVSFPDFQVHGRKNPEDDWLGASPDGAVGHTVCSPSSRGVLEIKCPFFKGNMKAAAPWGRMPLHIMPQVQGLMEIMDRDWLDLYVWTPNGSSLFRVPRDSYYWDSLRLALSDFWWGHVQPARQCCAVRDIRDPLNELSALKPSPKHHLCHYLIYESKRLVDRSSLLFREVH